MTGRRWHVPRSSLTLLVVVAFVACVLAVTATVLAVLFGTEQHRQTVRLNQLVGSIQDQRRTNVLGNCEAQNRRNRDTVATLDRLIAKVPPANQARAAQSRASTILIINALAPVQDCQALVAKQVKGGTP